MERDGAYIYLACLLRFAVATVVAPVEMIFNANFSTCIPAVLSVYLYASGYFLARLKGRAKKNGFPGKSVCTKRGKTGYRPKKSFCPVPHSYLTQTKTIVSIRITFGSGTESGTVEWQPAISLIGT